MLFAQSVEQLSLIRFMPGARTRHAEVILLRYLISLEWIQQQISAKLASKNHGSRGYTYE